MEEMNAAVEDFKAAVKLYPNFAGALYNLGLAYYTLNQSADARSCLQAAVTLDPVYSRSALSAALSKRSSGCKPASAVL